MGARFHPRERAFLAITMVLASVSLLFQNCSQSYSVKTQEGFDELGSQGITPQYYEVKMSERQEFPDLKMILVVDNSNTMEKNQVNLGRSFGAMFSGTEAANLTPFSTDVIVLSTTQANGSAVPADLSNQFPLIGANEIANLGLTPAQLEAAHRSLSIASARPFFANKKSLSGQIAGDVFGFRLMPSQAGVVQIKDFIPAPVLGISAGTNGLSVASPSVRKSKGVAADSVVSEVQSRLNLLSPNRNWGPRPVELNGYVYGQFDKSIDRESGLCGVARLLKRPNGFLKAGDIASLIVVSDENDSDPNGEQCLDQIRNFNVQENQDLVDVTCRQPTGLFTNTWAYKTIDPDHYEATVTYNRKEPGSCKVDAKSSLKVSYDYRVTTVTTPITHYTKANVCFNKVTTITFFASSQLCTERDGLKSCVEEVSTSPTTQDVIGDFSVSSGNCNATALKGSNLTASAILDRAELPFSCENSARRVQSGTTTTDCQTQISTNPIITTVSGDYSQTGGSCTADKISKIIANAVVDDPSRPFSCPVNPTVKNTDTLNQSINVKLSELTGVGVSPSAQNGDTCPKSLSDSKLSGLNLLKCSISWVMNTENPAPTYTQAEIDGRTGSSDSAKAALICSEKATQVCTNSSGSKIDCIGSVSSLPSIKPIVANSVRASGSFTCDMACSGVQSSLCKSGKSLSQSIDSIADVVAGSCSITNNIFVAERYPNQNKTTVDESSSLTCDSSCVGTKICGNTSYGSVGDFLGKTVTNFKPASCSSLGGTPLFNPDKVVTVAASQADSACGSGLVINKGNPYRRTNNVTENEFVSGGVNSAPSKDLVTYIKDRAKELLGDYSTQVTTFVLQAGDVAGPGQSVGTHYNRLADSLGGAKFSVTSNDYSPALRGLGEKIKRQMDRSIIVPGLQASMKVRQIWRKDSTGLFREKIPAEMWSNRGNSIVFSDQMNIKDQDEFKIQYY